MEFWSLEWLVCALLTATKSSILLSLEKKNEVGSLFTSLRTSPGEVLWNLSLISCLLEKFPPCRKRGEMGGERGAGWLNFVELIFFTSSTWVYPPFCVCNIACSLATKEQVRKPKLTHRLLYISFPAWTHIWCIVTSLKQSPNSRKYSLMDHLLCMFTSKPVLMSQEVHQR